MSEVVTFYCDLCQAKEEQSTWTPPEHCRIEIFVPAGRMRSVETIESNSSALSALFESWYGTETDHPTASVVPIPVSTGGERWGMSVCDRCCKRIAASFDLKLETLAEASVRLGETLNGWKPTGDGRDVRPVSAADLGMKGELVAQIPNQPGQGMPGVHSTTIQFPTPTSSAGSHPDGDFPIVAQRVRIEPSRASKKTSKKRAKR